MVIETIRILVSDKEPTPNKFTIAMGELIRKAREEAGLSQKELAEKIHRRQATLSDIETGKVEVSTVTLTGLSVVLNKPLSYFFPWFVYRQLKPEKFTPLEEELLTLFRQIYGDQLQKLAIDLIRVMANFDPKDLVIELAPHVKAELDLEKEQRDLFKKRKPK
jgi:transcriptional regulator with XRE-family HTH domain